MNANAPDDDVRAAIYDVYSWESDHNLMMKHLSSGDYAGTVHIATSVGSAGSSVTAFNQVDELLQSSIAESHLTAHENSDQSHYVITTLSLVTATLAVITAVLATFGLRHWLLEYLRSFRSPHRSAVSSVGGIGLSLVHSPLPVSLSIPVRLICLPMVPTLA